MRDYSRTLNKTVAYTVAAALIWTLNPAFGGKTEGPSDFLQAKTIFQTDRAYAPHFPAFRDSRRHGTIMRCYSRGRVSENQNVGRVGPDRDCARRT